MQTQRLFRVLGAALSGAGDQLQIDNSEGPSAGGVALFMIFVGLAATGYVVGLAAKEKIDKLKLDVAELKAQVTKLTAN